MKEKLLEKERTADEAEIKKLKKKLAKYKGKPERGIETWFRLASRNLYTRRKIVDTKSHNMVTTNALIMSVVLGALYPKLGEDPHMIFAVVVLILTNILSISYAVMATRPKIAKGTFSKKDVEEKKAGLMTFDDFFQMSHLDYQEAIEEMMKDGKFLYSTIKRDIYFLGLDLSKRYRFIRTSYDIFVVGIILSTISFALCHLIF